MAAPISVKEALSDAKSSRTLARTAHRIHALTKKHCTSHARTAHRMLALHALTKKMQKGLRKAVLSGHQRLQRHRAARMPQATKNGKVSS